MIIEVVLGNNKRMKTSDKHLGTDLRCSRTPRKLNLAFTDRRKRTKRHNDKFLRFIGQRQLELGAPWTSRAKSVYSKFD